MVQFVNTPDVGIYRDMDAINSYWDAEEQAAQRRYTNREARRSYATQQRRNMAVSQDNQQFYAENAGLFDDRQAMLAGIGQQRNVPAGAPTNPAAGVRPTTVTPAAASTTPTGTAQLLGAPNGDPATTPTAVAPTTTTPAPTPVATPTAGAWVPVNSANELTPEQNRAHQDYIRANYGGVGSASRRESTRRRVAELGLSYDMHGQLLRRTSGAAPGGLSGLPETFDISQQGPAAGQGLAERAAGITGSSSGEAGIADPTQSADAYFQGINDTGTPLALTPEMRLAAAGTQHAFRRAQILAAHGDVTGSDTAFAAAVQGQVQYIMMSRQVLFHAAAGGSRQAAEALIADVGGMDRTRVRLQPTQEATPRFNVQINTAAEGQPERWVSNAGTPQTFNQLISSLLNVADASGAQARAEASAEAERAMLQYQGTLQEVAGRERVALLNSMTELQKAQLDSDTRIALARGEGHVYTDPGTGNSWFVHPGIGQDGRPTSLVSLLRVQDLPGPSVDGNRDQTVPTPTLTPVG